MWGKQKVVEYQQRWHAGCEMHHANPGSRDDEGCRVFCAYVHEAPPGRYQSPYRQRAQSSTRPFPESLFLPCKKRFLLGLFCGGEIVQDSDLLGCYPSCPSFRPRAYLLSPSRWLAGSSRSSLNPDRSLAHSIPFKSVNGAQPESLAYFQTL